MSQEKPQKPESALLHRGGALSRVRTRCTLMSVSAACLCCAIGSCAQSGGVRPDSPFSRTLCRHPVCSTIGDSVEDSPRAAAVMEPRSVHAPQCHSETAMCSLQHTKRAPPRLQSFTPPLGCDRVSQHRRCASSALPPYHNRRPAQRTRAAAPHATVHTSTCAAVPHATLHASTTYIGSPAPLRLLGSVMSCATGAVKPPGTE